MRMLEGEQKYCIECENMVRYAIKKIPISMVIRDKKYQFNVTKAFCKECGEEIGIPSLIDINAAEIDEQYRSAEGIVTKTEIENVMNMYNIGKAPLSLALGFGEITITRYLLGQIPSKEYSDIIQSVKTSSGKMIEYLNKNKGKIGDTAYKKAMKSAKALDELFASVSVKMLSVISYIFMSIEEVTPLMLQKLLYYIQAMYYTKYNESIFPEQCEAWVHGPVYRNVYELFRDFKYNPIDDIRFSLLTGLMTEISNEETEVIDLILECFGIYSGKILEKITHKETPWLETRDGFLDNEASSNIITLDLMREYFTNQDNLYHIFSEEGLKKYIQNMIC